MKIYIAGKISGDPAYQDKFERAAEQLRAEGHVVLSPALLPSGLENEEYMTICVTMMSIADEVAFLPDYINSGGALIEYSLCAYGNKPIRRL